LLSKISVAVSCYNTYVQTHGAGWVELYDRGLWNCRMPIFLWSYTKRKVYGVYQAVCNGELKINPHGANPG
jgi:hypothetical protein